MAHTVGQVFKWAGIVFLVILGFVFIAGETNSSPQAPVSTSAQSAQPSPTTENTDAKQVSSSQGTALQAAPTQQSTNQASDSNAQTSPRNADGTIVQLKINASAESGSIAFTSEANYTNCSNNLTVVSVDGNQQPTFTTYTDNYSTGMNLFAGDQHSIAFGSLTDSNGDTLAADLNAGMYGSNTAGTWSLTCDQGQYSLVVNTL